MPLSYKLLQQAVESFDRFLNSKREKEAVENHYKQKLEMPPKSVKKSGAFLVLKIGSGG